MQNLLSLVQSTQISTDTMNFILVCLLVFTLGSLAAKIPTDVDKNEAPDTNPELLTKKSSELLNAVQDPSLITKRTFGKHNSGLYFILPVIHMKQWRHNYKRLVTRSLPLCRSANQKPL